MRITLLQFHSLVGAPKRNFDGLATQIREHAKHTDLFVAPELALTGYPPRDVLSQTRVLEQESQALESLRQLSAECGVGLLVGHTMKREGKGRPLFNAATLMDSGRIVGSVFKARNPSYDIFDEERFFESSPSGPRVLNFRGVSLGIAICEDNWDSSQAFGIRDIRSYDLNSNPFSKKIDASLLINLSASPYSLEKRAMREDLFCSISRRQKVPLLYCNAIGAQDGQIFEGGSFCVSREGDLKWRAKRFAEHALRFNFSEGVCTCVNPDEAPSEVSEREMLWGALTMGIRDYVLKSGHTKVVLGLSGGVDSALVAALASEALGPQNVLGLSLPSKITSDLSRNQAQELARNLGLEFREISIQSSVEAAQKSLGLDGGGVSFENLQSRMRGQFLMAFSNMEARLLLSTGNKSELALGYSTLYGDLCGALLPIGDLYKTEVYALLHWLNHSRSRTIIPLPTLLRPPTAELSPNQKDEDSLPPYEILDGVLFELIENQGQTVFSEESWNALLAPRFSVANIRDRMHRNEFKRFQAPPILKVHQRSFGRGWTFPLSKGDL